MDDAVTSTQILADWSTAKAGGNAGFTAST